MSSECVLVLASRLSLWAWKPQKRNFLFPKLAGRGNKVYFWTIRTNVGDAGPLYFIREILRHKGKAHRRAAARNSTVLLRFFFFKLWINIETLVLRVQRLLQICALHLIPFTSEVWNNTVTFIYPKGLQILHQNHNYVANSLCLTFIDHFNICAPLKSY